MYNCYRSVEMSSTLRSSRQRFENGLRSIQKNAKRLRKYWTRAQFRVCNLELVTSHSGILVLLETKLLVLKTS
jgi:hypothetical protein